MTRFAFLAAMLGAFSATAFASPVSGKGNATLSKREYSGQASYFYNGVGACGLTYTSDQPIVSLSGDIFNDREYCSQYISITNTNTGITQTGEIVDECTSCSGYDIDLSPSLFESLGADLSQGEIPVEWEFS